MVRYGNPFGSSNRVDGTVGIYSSVVELNVDLYLMQRNLKEDLGRF